MAVLVGVGTCLDAGAEPVELMARAAIAAAGDAGAPALLRRVDRIAVPQGTWSYPDPARLVAERIDAERARTVLVEIGVPQQSLVSDAIARIDGGEVDVALVVGGEGRRSAVPETPQPEGTAPDELVARTGEILARAEADVRLWNAVEQYALMESAFGGAEGRSLDEHRDDVARWWAAWNGVAQLNPEAAFPEPRDAAFLRDPGPDNRPLAFPYNKWHSTQWTVDQAGGLLLCSEDAARAAGIDRERWVHPVAALESSFALPLSRRADLHRWPAMELLGRAAAERAGRPLAAVEHVEVYSCFPIATRVQQRALDLAADVPPTVTGGMSFAGGPFNNFTYQATAAVVRRLRDAPGTLGMVTTVSGFLTKPGLMIWATAPDGRPPLVADLGEQAAAVTGRRDVAEGHRGPVTVAAYTVTYDGDRPGRVVVIGDTDDGRRAVTAIDDADLAERAVTDGLVGAALTVP